jgi:uncharacterized membrane protein YcjF (UPF0283 family)
LHNQNPLQRSRTQYSILWLVALAFICLGIYLSFICFMGQEWISRAGCAVAILGIWSGLGGIFQEHFLRRRLQWRRRHAISQAQRKYRATLDRKIIENEMNEIEKIFEERAAALAQQLRLSVGIVEVSLLITGTFLWGFGDLFYTCQA